MKANSKKLLSLLVVVAMVLAMAPAITLPASAATSMKLVDQWITDNDALFNADEALATPVGVSAECPACGGMQTWTPWTATGQQTLQGHVYLAKDITTTANTNYFIMGSGIAKACLYLNDHTINNMGMRGRMNCTTNTGVVNIFGDNDGGIVCNANSNKTSTYGVIDVGKTRTLNIYGGTYVNEQYENVAMFTSSGGKLNIYGGTFTANGGAFSTATAKLYGGTYDFDPSASVANTTVDADYEVTQSGGKYTVALPASANPAPETTKEKKQAVDTWRTENASRFTTAEEAEDEVEAFCPCCWEDVTWLPLTLSTNLTSGASGHYYVTGSGTSSVLSDANYIQTSNTATDSLCLYLNNKNLTVTGRIQIRCQVNLIGGGSLTRASGGGAAVPGLQVYGGTSPELNIYGGTYSSALNKPVMGINTAGGKINIYDGTFTHDTYQTIEDSAVTNQGTVMIYQATFTKGPDAYPDNFGPHSVSGNAVVSGNTTTWYPTKEGAVEAAAGNSAKAIKMFANGTLDLGGGSVYVDCNGKTVTVTNGTLYGFESTSGSGSYGARGGSWIIGDGVTVTRDVRFGGNRYVTLDNEGGTATSYRYDLDVTSIALRTSNAGLYYKTTLRAAPALANRVKAYGVVLSLDRMPGSDWEGKAKTMATCIEGAISVDGTTATVTSGILQNIMKAGQDNASRGEMDIYANAYLKFDFDNDDNYLEEAYIMAVDDNGADVVSNMQSVMETISTRWGDYAPAEGATVNLQDKVADFYKTWDMGSFGWTLDAIETYIDENA